MRDATRRIKKYDGKVDGETYKSKIEKYREKQVRNFKEAISKQVEIEREIKELISGRVDITDIPYYIIFGKQVEKLKRKYNDEALRKELLILEDIWKTRGLNEAILDEIKVRAGITITLKGYGANGYGLIPYGM